MEPYFDHERLEAYQLARELNREIRGVLQDVPKGYAESRQNLRRAAVSVARNIAEGSGRWSLADKIHFYHIARGSVTEGAASLDELVDLAALPPERIRKARAILARLVSMLIGLIRSLEERDGPDMSS